MRRCRPRADAEGGSVATYVDTLHDPEANQRYTREGTSKLPRAVDHELQMWGCVACNFCVTVCPNDAFLRLPTPGDMEVDGRQQYLCLFELCNQCGNCTTFCPEHGAPFEVKPRLYIDPERFATAPGQAFLVKAADGGFTAEAASGYESELANLVHLLNATEGLPLRPEDLTPAGRI